MPVSTTVIGSFPKPVYLSIPDWFKTSHSGSFTEQYNRYLEKSTESEREDTIKRATKEIIDLQAEAGVDVITDGEVRRESYILHFCRALHGFDFHNLFSKVCRNGAVTTDVPRIVGEVTLRQSEPWVWREWKISQDLTTLPMKVTLPGPMTIINSTEDQFYGDDKALGSALAKIISNEIKALVSSGCKQIQVGCHATLAQRMRLSRGVCPFVSEPMFSLGKRRPIVLYDLYQQLVFLSVFHNKIQLP